MGIGKVNVCFIYIGNTIFVRIGFVIPINIIGRVGNSAADNAVDWERYIDYRKSAVRCKVEHAFKIIKDTFDFGKVRYRGIAKIFNKLNVLFACANLLMVKRVQKDFCPTKG